MSARLAARVVAAARARSATVTTAESCTGGRVAAALTGIPGASAVFHAGFVTYSNEVKSRMLGVAPETLARDGAVSEPVAGEMATGALEAAGATLAVSVTGIAGPGGSEHKPEGRVCFGLARSGGAVTVETRDFGALGRRAVRQAATDHALALLLRGLAD